MTAHPDANLAMNDGHDVTESAKLMEMQLVSQSVGRHTSDATHATISRPDFIQMPIKFDTGYDFSSLKSNKGDRI